MRKYQILSDGWTYSLRYNLSLPITSITVSHPPLPPYTFILILNISLLNLCEVSPAWGELISPQCSALSQVSTVRRGPPHRQQPRVLPAAWRDWATPLRSSSIWKWSLHLNFSLFGYSGPWPWRGWGRWDRGRHTMSAKFPWGRKTRPSLDIQLWGDNHSCAAADAELSDSPCRGRLMFPLPSAFPAR